ncbi:hypothetical protein [Pontibacter pamirensis]|uniref:hypothetical protein n=1 Tax=Pontibacter pamirensis TaxID=2562824 RepID=UPI001389A1E9|nr:hypothetical protein [Pontibacter pamirensis]
MHFDIDRFFDRLQEEELTRQEASRAIHGEIRDAEAQKVAFLDQATENPVFYRLLCGQINRYMRHLRALHSRIAPHEKNVPEERELDTGDDRGCHTVKLLLQLEQLERRRGR